MMISRWVKIYAARMFYFRIFSSFYFNWCVELELPEFYRVVAIGGFKNKSEKLNQII